MNDSTQELLDAFHEEATEIIQGLEGLLEALEYGTGSGDSIITIANKIDGIMGCAKTLGLSDSPELSLVFKTIGQLSEGCKLLGYKASQIKDPSILRVIGGFLAEAIELLGSAIEDLKNGKLSFDQEAAQRSRERLVWIADKLQLSDEDQKNIMRHFGLA